MILKILFVLLLIIAFYFAIYYNIEKFNNYKNTNELSTDFNKFHSCLPYDIRLKNDKSKLYDYGNDELNEKFKKIFKINYQKQIALIEGNDWSNWITTKPPNNSYKYIINNFKNVLNKNPELELNGYRYQIISDKLNRYKYNLNDNSINLFDIDIIIHLSNRPLAKHLKIIAIVNYNLNIDYTLIKVIGVINEYNLLNDINEQEIIEENSINRYMEFIPEQKVVYDLNSFIYDPVDKLTNSAIEYNIYNNLLKELK